MKDEARADGKALPHDSAALHVSGAAHYVDDVPLPRGTLHLAFGLARVAAGRAEVDLARVRAAPGVALVLGPEDFDTVPDCSPAAGDEPLVSGEVHYAGQPLFLVAADSHLAARKAARLAEVRVEARTPLLTVEAAMAAGSHFEDGPRIWSKGDAAAAIAGAPQVVAGRIEIGGQEHFYLEGQAALAIPQDDGGMLVRSSSQHPTEIQHKVADALGLPMGAVRVEVRRMGGGFGGKESQGNHLAVACAVVAARTGHPAKMRYDRDDDFVVTGKRHAFRIDYRAGVDADGRIRGLDVTQYALCGWSQDLSLPVADRAMLHADNAYHLPAARITSWRLRTNQQSATAFRGFGGPQGMVGMERVIDHVAHMLGLDPLAVRRVNFYADAPVGEGGSEGASPLALPRDIFGTKREGGVEPSAAGGAVDGGADLASRGLAGADAVADRADAVAADGSGPAAGGQTTPYHMAVEDGVIEALTARLAETAGYAGRRAAVAEWNARNPVLKRGMALTPVKFGISFTLTHLNQAGALVHVYQDGSVAMNHGGTEMGQGLNRKVAQVAARRFGLPADAVRITAADTARVPNTSATAASSGADLNGMAVLDACDRIARRIAGVVAPELQADPADVVFQDGHVRAGGAAMPFAEAVKKTYLARVSLSATGFYATPGLEWDRIAGRGRPFYYFAYGAACTEVVIDTLTGENRILATHILHDCGTSLNPAIDRGQIEGGFVQGAGWLTTEELVWDDAGVLKTHAPSTYKIPAMSDRPDVFEVAFWDRPNPVNTIHRSKAVGEPPLMLAISVLMALSDACAACGPHYPDLQAPATPEAVLAAVERARGAG